MHWAPDRRQLRLAAALALLASATPAVALDPRAPASSYLRTKFTTEDGLLTNIVNTIFQSKDGFLWIGTYTGLTRFDGRHFSGTGTPEVLQEGRRGHYGLCGMRGPGRSAVSWKSGVRPGAGTEIELSVMGSIAYRAPTGRSRFRLFRGKQVEA